VSVVCAEELVAKQSAWMRTNNSYCLCNLYYIYYNNIREITEITVCLILNFLIANVHTFSYGKRHSNFLSIRIMEAMVEETPKLAPQTPPREMRSHERLAK
jgi:hypothetical protein